MWLIGEEEKDRTDLKKVCRRTNERTGIRGILSKDSFRPKKYLSDLKLFFPDYFLGLAFSTGRRHILCKRKLHQCQSAKFQFCDKSTFSGGKYFFPHLHSKYKPLKKTSSNISHKYISSKYIYKYQNISCSLSSPLQSLSSALSNLFFIISF